MTGRMWMRCDDEGLGRGWGRGGGDGGERGGKREQEQERKQKRKRKRVGPSYGQGKNTCGGQDRSKARDT